jgi:hypothetical protein
MSRRPPAGGSNSFRERSPKSFIKKMTNHISLFLEAATARKRLAQLFQSELGQGNRLSTAIVACGLSRAARTGTQQNKSLLHARRWLIITPRDWTWWWWLVTACLLLIGLMGMPEAFLTALLLAIAQSVLLFVRERALGAFPVQLRLAYTLLLIICFFSSDPLALLAARCRCLCPCHIRILSDGKNAFPPTVEPHRTDYGRLGAPNISVPTQTTGSAR